MINPWSKVKEWWFTQGWNQGYKKAQMEAEIDLEADKQLIAKLDRQIKEMEAGWFVDKFKVFSVHSDGGVYLGDNQITKQELGVLKADLKVIKNLSFWNVFVETLRQKAVEKSVINSKVDDIKEQNLELLGGKMMLHNLGIMKSIMDLIEKLQ